MNIPSTSRRLGAELLVSFRRDKPAVRLFALALILLPAILTSFAVMATVVAKTKGWW